jgi:hypothetical protein
MSAGGIAPGTYVATFAGIDPQPADPARGYGPGIRWKFTISEGPLAGQTASRITPPSPTLRNACGKMLAGLIGRPLADRESADPSMYLGKRYTVTVAAGQAGGSRIEYVSPIG